MNTAIEMSTSATSAHIPSALIRTTIRISSSSTSLLVHRTSRYYSQLPTFHRVSCTTTPTCKPERVFYVLPWTPKRQANAKYNRRLILLLHLQHVAFQSINQSINPVPTSPTSPSRPISQSSPLQIIKPQQPSSQQPSASSTSLSW